MSKSNRAPFFAPTRGIQVALCGRVLGIASIAGIGLACLTTSATAFAQSASESKTAAHLSDVGPPPVNVDYFQFGLGFTGEFNVSSGAICPPKAQAPCIWGSGGGVAARAGYRSRGPWYVGGAYQFDRIDTNSLMRLGVLQQLRAETRYLLNLGWRTEPYVVGGLGGVAFGNEWGFETFGLTAFLGLGFEVQISRTAVVGAALVHRPVLLFGWTDRAQQERDTGLAHFIGLDVVLESREPLGIH